MRGTGPSALRRGISAAQASPVDAAYIVTVPELPGCRTHGVTTVEAAEMGREAIEGWLDAQRARGRTVPSPRTYDRFYSESDVPAPVAL